MSGPLVVVDADVLGRAAPATRRTSRTCCARCPLAAPTSASPR